MTIIKNRTFIDDVVSKFLWENDLLTYVLHKLELFDEFSGQYKLSVVQVNTTDSPKIVLFSDLNSILFIKDCTLYAICYWIGSYNATLDDNSKKNSFILSVLEKYT